MKRKALDKLIKLLDLEQLEDNLFRGQSENIGGPRVFGGQVLGQALTAAARTVDKKRSVHSLHAYFLRPGVLKQPVLFSVDPVRNGRSFSTRTVKAIQNNEVIFTMSVSFQIEEEGISHSIEMPKVPPPEDLKDEIQLREENIDKVPEELRPFLLSKREYSIKWVEWNDILNPKKLPPIRNIWLKPNGKIPSDRSKQYAFLAYVSDSGLLAPCLYPHGMSFMSPNLMMASLDHAMWFHRPFKADEWLLYQQDSPSASGARGFNRGSIFDTDGNLIASVAQEGLIRVVKS